MKTTLFLALLALSITACDHGSNEVDTFSLTGKWEVVSLVTTDSSQIVFSWSATENDSLSDTIEFRSGGIAVSSYSKSSDTLAFSTYFLKDDTISMDPDSLSDGKGFLRIYNKVEKRWEPEGFFYWDLIWWGTNKEVLEKESGKFKMRVKGISQDENISMDVGFRKIEAN